MFKIIFFAIILAVCGCKKKANGDQGKTSSLVDKKGYIVGLLAMEKMQHENHEEQKYNFVVCQSFDGDKTDRSNHREHPLIYQVPKNCRSIFRKDEKEPYFVNAPTPKLYGFLKGKKIEIKLDQVEDSTLNKFLTDIFNSKKFELSRYTGIYNTFKIMKTLKKEHLIEAKFNSDDKFVLRWISSMNSYPSTPLPLLPPKKAKFIGPDIHSL